MIRENGWFYQPFRKPGENRVYIGRCNFGDVSFDYKNKGCIENMYFENVKAGEEQGIRDAIRKARDIEDNRYSESGDRNLLRDRRENGLRGEKG